MAVWRGDVVATSRATWGIKKNRLSARQHVFMKLERLLLPLNKIGEESLASSAQESKGCSVDRVRDAISGKLAKITKQPRSALKINHSTE